MTHVLVIGLALKKKKKNSMYTCSPDLCHFPHLPWGSQKEPRNPDPSVVPSSEKFILHCIQIRVKDSSSPWIISGPISRTVSSGHLFGSYSLNTLSPAQFKCGKSQGIHELHRQKLGTFSVSLFRNFLSHLLGEYRLWKICMQHLRCAKHCVSPKKTY